MSFVNLGRLYYNSTMKAAEFILDLIFPKICQACGIEGSYLCTNCQADIEPPVMFCPECDKPATLGAAHPICLNKNTPLNSLMVTAKYKNRAVRNLVWQLKYNSAKNIAEDLSLILTDFIIKNDLLDFFADAAVAAVPLHKSRLSLRGYNQSELLAINLAKKLNLPYGRFLKKNKKTPRQVDLEKEERKLNVQNSFIFNHELKPAKKILLIDDVATTGSTMLECAKILKQAGVKEVHALVVARNKR